MFAHGVCMCLFLFTLTNCQNFLPLEQKTYYDNGEKHEVTRYAVVPTTDYHNVLYNIKKAPCSKQNQENLNNNINTGYDTDINGNKLKDCNQNSESYEAASQTNQFSSNKENIHSQNSNSKTSYELKVNEKTDPNTIIITYDDAMTKPKAKQVKTVKTVQSYQTGGDGKVNNVYHSYNTLNSGAKHEYNIQDSEYIEWLKSRYATGDISKSEYLILLNKLVSQLNTRKQADSNIGPDPNSAEYLYMLKTLQNAQAIMGPDPGTSEDERARKKIQYQLELKKNQTSNNDSALDLSDTESRGWHGHIDLTARRDFPNNVKTSPYYTIQYTNGHFDTGHPKYHNMVENYNYHDVVAPELKTRKYSLISNAPSYPSYKMDPELNTIQLSDSNSVSGYNSKTLNYNDVHYRGEYPSGINVRAFGDGEGPDENTQEYKDMLLKLLYHLRDGQGPDLGSADYKSMLQKLTKKLNLVPVGQGPDPGSAEFASMVKALLNKIDINDPETPGKPKISGDSMGPDPDSPEAANMEIPSYQRSSAYYNFVTRGQNPNISIRDDANPEKYLLNKEELSYGNDYEKYSGAQYDQQSQNYRKEDRLSVPEKAVPYQEGNYLQDITTNRNQDDSSSSNALKQLDFNSESYKEADDGVVSFNPNSTPSVPDYSSPTYHGYLRENEDLMYSSQRPEHVTYNAVDQNDISNFYNRDDTLHFKDMPYSYTYNDPSLRSLPTQWSQQYINYGVPTSTNGNQYLYSYWPGLTAYQYPTQLNGNTYNPYNPFINRINDHQTDNVYPKTTHNGPYVTDINTNSNPYLLYNDINQDSQMGGYKQNEDSYEGLNADIYKEYSKLYLEHLRNKRLHPASNAPLNFGLDPYSKDQYDQSGTFSENMSQDKFGHYDRDDSIYQENIQNTLKTQSSVPTNPLTYDQFNKNEISEFEDPNLILQIKQIISSNGVQLGSGDRHQTVINIIKYLKEYGMIPQYVSTTELVVIYNIINREIENVATMKKNGVRNSGNTLVHLHNHYHHYPSKGCELSGFVRKFLKLLVSNEL